MTALERLSARAGILSEKLNTIVELIVALLLGILVLDVWLAVLDRYLFHWQLPWPEVLARFLMIWAALLAVSCGVARREHIGLGMLIQKFPTGLRSVILIGVDVLALCLFVALVYYGLEFAEKGSSRQAQILGLTLLVPFASVSVCGLLGGIQTVLVGIRDLGHYVIGGSGEDV